MSTFEAKVDQAYKFLVNRASLGRVTNYEELGRVLGQKLMESAQRRIDTPVRREKLPKVLRAVDDRSLSEKGVLLSALVVHFWDNDAGHRFFEAAGARGLYDGSPGREFHKAQLANTIAAYGGAVSVPDDASELDEVAAEAPLTRAEVRKIAHEIARKEVEAF